jgi:3-oxoacyl-[acyl-carrier protein] reductase
MRILAYEYGRYGITANTIATGPFHSELSDAYLATKPEIKTSEWYLQQLPVGRWGEPEEWAPSRPSSVPSERPFLLGKLSASTAATPRASFDA